MSAQITASMVKELRDQTGAGMMDAKKALEEAQGDMAKAAEILRQKGIASAEKKSGRAAAEGMVASLISDDGSQGVMVEVNCETDFVARGDQFRALVDTLTRQVLHSSAKDKVAFMAESCEEAGGQSVEDYIKENVGVIKENISLRRFDRYSLTGSGVVYSYIHTGNKIGVLIEVQTASDALKGNPEFTQMVKDLALHIASSAPEFVGRDEIPQSTIEDEKRIEMGKEDLQNKPENIRAQIVEGRVNKLLGQRILLEQPFVKDMGKTVGDLLKEKSQELKTDIQVKRFVRYMLGEGLEKRESNFAEEVMAQVKG